jgi:hypothetical protein
MSDHQGRIGIPIMHGAAVLAGPRVDVQRHLIRFEPAAVARLDVATRWSVKTKCLPTCWHLYSILVRKLFHAASPIALARQ